ncbi:hypothetical protein AB1M95_12420 [Sulfitobacter sp. LCG007]
MAEDSCYYPQTRPANNRGIAGLLVFVVSALAYSVFEPRIERSEDGVGYTLQSDQTERWFFGESQTLLASAD